MFESISSAITALGTMLMAGAAVAGATAAFIGLNTWRTQSKWQYDRDLARNLSIGFMKRRDAVDHIRNPFGWSGEEDVGDVEYPQRERKWRGVQAKYQKRWDKLFEVRQGLYSDLVEGEVAWGEEFSSKDKAIATLENDLRYAIEMYIESHDPANSGEDIFGGKEKARENRRMLYGRGADDAFGQSYNQTVDNMVAYLRAKMDS